MKKDKNLLPFENILTGYYSGKAPQLLNGFSDMEADLIFSQAVDVSMPLVKANEMIRSLTIKLGKESLGALVSGSLSQQAITDQQLQEKTGLTPSLLDAIKKDMVFTNSVPVKSLVKLLKLLGLSLDSALSSIQVTFDKLQTESKTFGAVPLTLQPSFRKGMIRGEIGKDLSHLKSDESYLYQNEQALNKYTNRMTELFNTL